MKIEGAVTAMISEYPFKGFSGRKQGLKMIKMKNP